MSLSIATTAAPAAAEHARLPPLQPGDRLSRDEFERRYRLMPQLKKAELIEGVVHMPSPVTDEGHGHPHFRLITWLGTYEMHTPGVRGGDNSTVRLDLDNELQPDAHLRLLPHCGGLARLSEPEGYVAGPPEFIAEVSATTASYDLHDKLHVYRRSGVREYLVWRVWDREIDWFELRSGQYERLTPAQGVLKSAVFPGLWLDAAALVADDARQVLAVLLEGVASADHAAFVQRLQSAGQSPA